MGISSFRFFFVSTTLSACLPACLHLYALKRTSFFSGFLFIMVFRERENISWTFFCSLRVCSGAQTSVLRSDSELKYMFNVYSKRNRFEDAAQRTKRCNLQAKYVNCAMMAESNEFLGESLWVMSELSGILIWFASYNLLLSFEFMACLKFHETSCA